MKKRGQIATFVIIGIILLAVIGFLLYQRGTILNFNSGGQTTNGIAPIELFVQQCLEKTTEDALQIIGYQGGYVNPNPLSIKIGEYNSAFGYYEGKSSLVTMDQLNFEMFTYVNDNLKNCTNNFKNFRGYVITGELQNMNITYQPEKITIKTHYPLKIIHNDETLNLDRFVFSLPVRLKYIHDVSNDLVERSITVAPYLIDLDYLSSVDLNITAIPYKNNTIVYVIRDDKSKINNEPYLFMFTSKVEEPYSITMQEINMKIINNTFYANLLDPSSDEFFGLPKKPTDEEIAGINLTEKKDTNESTTNMEIIEELY